MLKEIFDIEKFNIISDDENYYFFRALNMGDNKDIESGLTLDENGHIKRVRTDRERYDGVPKYNENSQMSLEEVFNHVKMHHRIDTNCISLTSNANAAILYGRGYYKDKYIMVKVPKKDFGDKVSTAGLYMMEEINKKIDEYVKTSDLDELQKYYLDFIENAQNQETLDRLQDIKKQVANEKDSDIFEKGIDIHHSETISVDYQALSPEQNFQKNKLIAKLNVIQKNMLPEVKNLFLIRTLGNAFSSLELIHYNDIQQNEIVEISTELVDALSLLQQFPKRISIIEDLKKDIINFISSNKKILSNFQYNDYELNADDEYTIEKMYYLTNGNVNYFDSVNIYKKSFYLAKSKLRADNIANVIRIVTNNNSKYDTVIEYIRKSTYGVEPEIFSRVSSNKLNVSESVSLDFSNKEIEHFSYINQLPNDKLTYILENPTENLKMLLENLSSVERKNIDQDLYYANAIVDLFDWTKKDVVSFSNRQRTQIINSLRNSNVVGVYNALKNYGVKEKDIANALLTVVIKNKDLNKIDLNDTFTLEELEDFLGYYQVNNSKGLRLRSYQAKTLENIDETFKTKQFVSAVLPTGAGKSFVALSEMLEHSDEEVLYLAPNDYILNQVRSNILDYICDEDLTKTDDEKIKEKFPKLKLATYQSLITDNKNGLINDKDKIQNTINKKYKLIVFDELHRTGAKEWCSSIEVLLDHQDKDVKVLGITATPLRDMDNRNMADEWAKYYGYSDEEIIKENHMAMNMDLLEAIRLGYVVEPKVVNCEYSLQDQNGFMDKMLDIINQGTENEKTVNLAKYDSLRRRVEQAAGINEILNNNIKQGGKYIVFCPVINKDGKILEDEDGFEEDYRINSEEVIKKYKDELTSYLGDKFTLDFYNVLGKYGKSKNTKQIDEFEKDDPNRVKFMLCINLLNEGVHVPNVDGSIWYRPLDENSNILYHQQLGRVIYSVDPNKELPDEKRPVVIDLVNNTLRINMNRDKVTKPSDLSKLKIVIGWIEQHDMRMPDINSYDRIESSHACTLEYIQKKYMAYIQNANLFENLNSIRKTEINAIIEIGNNIDLWSYIFPERIRENKAKSSSEDLSLFKLTEIMRDYSELYKNIETNTRPAQQMVKRIIEFCNTYKKWPNYSKNENLKTSDGTTSTQLSQWLSTTSGYTSGKFKYINEFDETGRSLKEILDELYILYGKPSRTSDEHKILWVRKVEEYCTTYGEWPKQGVLDKRINDGTTSQRLAQWLSTTAGYTTGKFKYANIHDETGRSLKEILDELYNLYGKPSKRLDDSKILWIRIIEEYCNTYKELPKHGVIDKKTSDGTTSSQIAQWLDNSGYSKNRFKYSDVLDENGQSIKVILDELYQKYGSEKLNSDEPKIRWVKKVEEYCNTYKEWPSKSVKDIKMISDGTTSVLIAQWLGNSGYATDKFKYANIHDETGRSLKEILDELYKLYGKPSRTSDYSKILWVKRLEEYCNTYKEWPNKSSKDIKVTSDGTTTHQLYNWLRVSGYSLNEFIYDDILDESGRPIKMTIDELYQKYGSEKLSSDDIKVQWIKRIREYCNTYKEWPKKTKVPKYISDGTSSTKLAHWLIDSGYSKGNFKCEVLDEETGRPFKNILDELFNTYGKPTVFSDDSKIIWVKKVKEYCETYKEWPKHGVIDKKTSDGTTSNQLASWIRQSGFTYGNFKYFDIKDNDGKPIYDILCELSKEYSMKKSSNINENFIMPSDSLNLLYLENVDSYGKKR